MMEGKMTIARNDLAGNDSAIRHRSLPGRDQRDGLASVLAVGPKVGVECEHLPVLVQFRHANETGVRQRHRHIAIPAYQFEDRGKFVAQVEVADHDVSFQEATKLFRCLDGRAHQEERLGDHRVAGEQRAFEPLELGCCPRIMFVAFEKTRDQRTGVKQDGTGHSLPDAWDYWTSRWASWGRPPTRSGP